MDDEALKPLEAAAESTPFDYGLTAAKLGALVFPFLGTGVTLFDLLTGPIRGNRFNNWCEQLRLRLNEVSQKVKGMTPEKLATSEEFISAFAHATQAALRTHHEEKLEALRNAVLNVAANRQFSEEQQGIFLSLVDSLEPIHLRILKYFDEPDVKRIGKPQPMPDLISMVDMIEITQQHVLGVDAFSFDATATLVEDLRRAGLLYQSSERPMRLTERWTSDWGHSFLAFVSEPRDTDGN